MYTSHSLLDYIPVINMIFERFTFSYSVINVVSFFSIRGFVTVDLDFSVCFEGPEISQKVRWFASISALELRTSPGMKIHTIPFSIVTQTQ